MKNKKAISLIVLVITIIVMIILASAIIMSLDNANIFNKAEEAVEKTNAATNKYLSEIKLAERELEKIQGPSKVTDENPGVLSGKGTTEEPYLIESIEDLVAFSDEVNDGRTFDGEIVKLTRLLDFKSDNSYVNPNSGLKEQLIGENSSKGFIPIGKKTYNGSSWDEKPFKGTFDGDGAEIRNIYINNDELENVGLFGYAQDAVIKNIGVTGEITAINAYTGTIVGTMVTIEEKAIIENCYSKGNHKGYSIGGIVGIQYHHNNATIEELSIIQDCYNEAVLATIDAGYIGGILSEAEHVFINRCYNKGDLKSETIEAIAGGIAMDTLYSKIQNSYNEGNIIIKDLTAGGGITHRSLETIIENVYNAGKIETSNAYIPGVLMTSLGSGSTLNNFFSIGESKNIKYLVETIVDNTVINDIYCLETNIKETNIGSFPEGSLTQMSMSEMKSQAFVDTLNNNIKDRPDLVKWKMGSNGYPTLDM